MEGRKKMEEFYRKLKVGMKLKYAFTTVIVTFAVAMVVSLVSIVMMNVDTYKFYREAYANSTLQMEIRKDIQLVGKYILWSMTTDDTGSTQSYLNSAQKYADQVGKNVTTLKKSFHDKKESCGIKDPKPTRPSGIKQCQSFVIFILLRQFHERYPLFFQFFYRIF